MRNKFWIFFFFFPFEVKTVCLTRSLLIIYAYAVYKLSQGRHFVPFLITVQQRLKHLFSTQSMSQHFSTLTLRAAVFFLWQPP